MPFPTEHAARLKSPAKFDKIRRKQAGGGVSLILGISGGKSEVISIRFDKGRFTPAQARQWLDKNGYKATQFEPAQKAQHVAIVAGFLTERHLAGKHNQKLHSGGARQLVMDFTKPKAKGKPKLSKATAPGAGIEVSDKARQWLMSDMEKTKFQTGQFTDELNVIDVSSQTKSAYKKKVAGTLAKDTGIPETHTSHFVRQWSETSNDSSYGSLETQNVAGEMFGVGMSDWQKERWTKADEKQKKLLKDNPPVDNRFRDIRGPLTEEGSKSSYQTDRGTLHRNMRGDNRERGEYKTPREATRATLDAMYKNTQSELKKAGITEVILYRGTHKKIDAKAGETVTMSGNSLESWSLNPRTAFGFAGFDGKILKTKVKADRIFSTPKTGFGALDETEFILIGGKNFGEATILPTFEAANAFR